jgi:hypothetical protein
MNESLNPKAAVEKARETSRETATQFEQFAHDTPEAMRAFAESSSDAVPASTSPKVSLEPRILPKRWSCMEPIGASSWTRWQPKPRRCAYCRAM